MMLRHASKPMRSYTSKKVLVGEGVLAKIGFHARSAEDTPAFQTSLEVQTITVPCTPTARVVEVHTQNRVSNAANTCETKGH